MAAFAVFADVFAHANAHAVGGAREIRHADARAVRERRAHEDLFARIEEELSDVLLFHASPQTFDDDD